MIQLPVMNRPAYITLWSFRYAGEKAEEKFRTLKSEGNDFVKKGKYDEAVNKYSECLKLNPKDCTIYTNR